MLTRRERIIQQATKMAAEHGLTLANIQSPSSWKHKPRTKIQVRNAILAHIWETNQPILLVRLADLFDTDHTMIAYAIGAHYIAIGKLDHPFAQQCLRRRKYMKRLPSEKKNAT